MVESFGRQLLVTIGVDGEVNNNPKFSEFAQECLTRFAHNDWGEMCEEDIAANNYALTHQQRLLASYDFTDGVEVEGEDKLWIITEWDRSVTTMLFPSEY